MAVASDVRMVPAPFSNGGQVSVGCMMQGTTAYAVRECDRTSMLNHAPHPECAARYPPTTPLVKPADIVLLFYFFGSHMATDTLAAGGPLPASAKSAPFGHISHGVVFVSE